MNLLIAYEIPLFIFVFLGIYTISQLRLAAKPYSGGTIKKSYNWFMISASFLVLWAIDHIYHDLIPLSVEVRDFFHYIISHGFLLLAMICFTIAAKKIKDMSKEMN